MFARQNAVFLSFDRIETGKPISYAVYFYACIFYHEFHQRSTLRNSYIGLLMYLVGDSGGGGGVAAIMFVYAFLFTHTHTQKKINSS